MEAKELRIGNYIYNGIEVCEVRQIDASDPFDRDYPKIYPDEKFHSGELTAWDTLRVFNDTCGNHKFKTKNK